MVLGDAEYSHEAVVSWLQSVHWDFVLHIKANCLVRTTDDPAWQPVQELCETSQLQSGQVKHWEHACFTQEHRLADLTITIHWGAGEDAPLCLVSNLAARASNRTCFTSGAFGSKPCSAATKRVALAWRVRI